MDEFSVWIFSKEERQDLVLMGFKLLGRVMGGYHYGISESEWDRLGKPR